jgi:hypothetical protein
MDALRLLGNALALRPTLIVSDWRAMATAIAIVLPEFARVWLVAKAKEMQRRPPEHHRVGQE